MTKLVDKFVDLERYIAATKGEFRVFALIFREGAWDRWDLVVAAPWAANQGLLAPLRYLFAQIKSRIGAKGLRSISTILLLQPSEDAVKNFNETYSVKHGKLEIRDTELFGKSIDRAFIITSQRRAASARQRRARSRHAGVR